MSKKEQSPLERVEELFAFLQGNVPEGYFIKCKEAPRLTADQAWTVIWYLGNQYWQVPDFIERCDVCGELYDSNGGGECLDYGNAPYQFCDSCRDGTEFEKKMRRNPDKQRKEVYFAK